MNNCKNCGKPCKIKFCSHSCSAKYTNVNRTYRPSNDFDKYKEVSCKKCGDICKVNIRSPNKNSLCNNCRTGYAVFIGNTNDKTRVKTIPGKCKCCGQYNCKNKICKWFIFGGERTSARLGVVFTKKGTTGIFDEIVKVRDIYRDMYYTNEMSLPEIQKVTGVFVRSIQTIFNLFDMKFRNLSDSVSLSRVKHPEYKTSKIHKHTTWDGKEVVLRSTNELNIAKQLDVERVEYKTEAFRIAYVAANGCERFYVPDFYIPSKNLIIEAKGSYYADENCPLKAAAARNMGYNYQYVLDDVITDI